MRGTAPCGFRTGMSLRIVAGILAPNMVNGMGAIHLGRPLRFARAPGESQGLQGMTASGANEPGAVDGGIVSLSYVGHPRPAATDPERYVLEINVAMG